MQLNLQKEKDEIGSYQLEESISNVILSGGAAQTSSDVLTLEALKELNQNFKDIIAANQVTRGQKNINFGGPQTA